VAILDLVKRASLTKAVIILVLLAAARYYRLALGTNVAGIMLGFAAYLGINVANFALREKLGAVIYGATFSTIGPLSYTLCLLVWTVALWRCEPALSSVREIPADERGISDSVAYQIARFNGALGRLLRR
jgi:hypothetical protein